MTVADRRATPWERRGPTGDGDGRLLIRLSWAGTAISCATAIANAATGDRSDFLLSAIPGLVMFVLGSAAFLAAFLLAVQRSRTEAIGVGGLYFLAGCAPRAVQRTMMASVVVQTVVPLAVTMVRPFVAFSVLAPMWSLGLAGLWGAQHGTFPLRTDPDRSADAQVDRAASPHPDALLDRSPRPSARLPAVDPDEARDAARSARTGSDGPDFASDGRGTEAPPDG